MDHHLVFVYGTLKRGLPNNFFLKNSGFVSEAKVRGLLVQCIGMTYPYLILTDQSCDGWVVTGELWTVTNATLSQLDGLEGYDPNNPNNSYYLRSKVQVKTMPPSIESGPHNEEVEAWVYHAVGNTINQVELIGRYPETVSTEIFISGNWSLDANRVAEDMDLYRGLVYRRREQQNGEDTLAAGGAVRPRNRRTQPPPPPPIPVVVDEDEDVEEEDDIDVDEDDGP